MQTDDKCYAQLCRNIITNLVVTLQPMAVTTKFIVTAVKTKLVVSAYFLESCLRGAAVKIKKQTNFSLYYHFRSIRHFVRKHFNYLPDEDR